MGNLKLRYEITLETKNNENIAVDAYTYAIVFRLPVGDKSNQQGAELLKTKTGKEYIKLSVATTKKAIESGRREIRLSNNKNGKDSTHVVVKYG